MKSLAAVITGFAAMAGLVMISTYAAVELLLAGGTTPTPAYLAVNLLYSTVAAMAGGWLTARMAPKPAGERRRAAPFAAHVVALAALVAVLGVASAVATPPQPGQPTWYEPVMSLLGPIGVLLGGSAVLRRPRLA